MPIAFDFRNFSTTHDARFILRLSNAEMDSSPPSLLSPLYSGRLSRKGELGPGKGTRLTVKIQVRQPGAYPISSWRTETEVLEDVTQDTEDAGGPQSTPRSSKRLVRRRYTDLPSRTNTIIITVLQSI